MVPAAELTPTWTGGGGQPTFWCTGSVTSEIPAGIGAQLDDQHRGALGAADLPVGGKPVRRVGTSAGRRVAYVAHPYGPARVRTRSNNAPTPGRCRDLQWQRGIRGWQRGDSSLLWDEALQRGLRLHAIATDDSHMPLFDIGLAWTWVKVRRAYPGRGDRGLRAVTPTRRAGRASSRSTPPTTALRFAARRCVPST